jgi:hypothetical protein
MPLGLRRPWRLEVTLESLLSIRMRSLRQQQAKETCAAALTHPRGKQKFHGGDKGQDSLPSGCRQTVLRNRCFRMSSQGASRNVSRGQNPNDIKQETRTVCNLKVCTLIDILTYRGVA